MNIVYGISGFGNGHVARAASVIKALLARGHTIAVFGFNNSERYIKAHFPDVQLMPIKVPVLHPSPAGLDFGKIADDPANHYCDGVQMNYRAMQDALDYFDGPPDLVISDYELVAAQFAYASLRPLISIDQHSKYAGFQFPAINGYSRLEDYARLNLFFPYADARFAASFFQVDEAPDPKFHVDLIPPILRQDVLDLKPQVTSGAGEIVVYISGFATVRQSRDAIYDVLKQLSDRAFHIFSVEEERQDANLWFNSFSTERFLEKLIRCDGVITTAGHNLLSELMYFHKPVYVIPSTTFDQQMCAQVIQQNQLGLRTDYVDIASLTQFFDNIDRYRDHIQQSSGLVRDFDGVPVLMQKLEQRFGL